MAKKIAGSFKVQIKAGEATMAPPVGPVFGQRGLNGMEFVKQFNAKSAKEEKGLLLPVVVTYFTDKSFTFIVKSPPTAVLLKKIAGLKSGSGEPNKKRVGTVTVAQCEEIAKLKMQDLNCDTIEAGTSMIKGAARSMGIVVE